MEVGEGHAGKWTGDWGLGEGSWICCQAWVWSRHRGPDWRAQQPQTWVLRSDLPSGVRGLLSYAFQLSFLNQPHIDFPGEDIFCCKCTADLKGFEFIRVYVGDRCTELIKNQCAFFFFSVGWEGSALGQMCPLLSEPTRQPSHVRLNCLHSQPGTESERTKAPWALCFCERQGHPHLCGCRWDLPGEEEKSWASKSSGRAVDPPCFGEGFVFGRAIINSCSAAQTTCQVSHLCLFTGQTVLSYRARETKSRMQVSASWARSQACLQWQELRTDPHSGSQRPSHGAFCCH